MQVEVAIHGVHEQYPKLVMDQDVLYIGKERPEKAVK